MRPNEETVPVSRMLFSLVLLGAVGRLTAAAAYPVQRRQSNQSHRSCFGQIENAAGPASIEPIAIEIFPVTSRGNSLEPADSER